MIPEQTLLNFPVFGDNATKVEPDNNKKSAGWQQADVVPAEWMNWEWYHASKGISDLNDGVKSMEKEMNSVLSAAGISPSESTNNQLLTSIFKLVYPVGSLYWTSKAPNDGGDPSSLFGGTWVQIKDKFILAAGDTYSNGATGGAATVTLTVNQMPSHNHGGATEIENQSHTHSGPTEQGGVDHDHAFSYSYSVANVVDGGIQLSDFSTSPASKTLYRRTETNTGATGTASAYLHRHDFTTGVESQNHVHNISAQGGGEAHNNMPPYIVKYCWERTA